MWKEVRAFVSHTSIWGMGLVFLIGLVMTADHFDRGVVWLAIAIGISLFYITEYTTHRFVFHGKPPKNPQLLKVFKRLHYDHHESPTDLRLLFLPIWYGLLNMVVVWVVTFLLTRSLVVPWALITGATASLLYYEWTHFVAHRPIIPQTSWGKWMKKYHLWHHFKNEHYWFGVTNPSMDYLGSTYKSVEDVELSPTARKLYQEADLNTPF